MTTSEEIKALIESSFDEDGYLKYPKSRARAKKAKALMEMEDYDPYLIVSGGEAHYALLVIAYPNKSI